MSAVIDSVEDQSLWRKMDDEGFIALVGPMWTGPMTETSGLFRFQAEPKHENLRGVVQGGMLMTFADRAMGMTARQGDLQTPQATVQLDVHFIEGVEIGDVVEISCTILKRTNSLIFMDGVLRVGDRMVATARGTWKRLRRRPEA